MVEGPTGMFKMGAIMLEIPKVLVYEDGTKMEVSCDTDEFKQIMELICKIIPQAEGLPEYNTDKVAEVRVLNLSAPSVKKPRSWFANSGLFILALIVLIVIGAGLYKIVEDFRDIFG